MRPSALAMFMRWIIRWNGALWNTAVAADDADDAVIIFTCMYCQPVISRYSIANLAICGDDDSS